jgi:hypothetical protein
LKLFKSETIPLNFEIDLIMFPLLFSSNFYLFIMSPLHFSCKDSFHMSPSLLITKDSFFLLQNVGHSWVTTFYVCARLEKMWHLVFCEHANWLELLLKNVITQHGPIFHISLLQFETLRIYSSTWIYNFSHTQSIKVPMECLRISVCPIFSIKFLLNLTGYYYYYELWVTGTLLDFAWRCKLSNWLDSCELARLYSTENKAMTKEKKRKKIWKRKDMILI